MRTWPKSRPNRGSKKADRKSTRLNSSHPSISFYTLSLHDALPILLQGVDKLMGDKGSAVRRSRIVAGRTKGYVISDSIGQSTDCARRLRGGGIRMDAHVA